MPNKDSNIIILHEFDKISVEYETLRINPPKVQLMKKFREYYPNTTLGYALLIVDIYCQQRSMFVNTLGGIQERISSDGVLVAFKKKE